MFETFASDTDTFQPTPQYPAGAAPSALHPPILETFARDAALRNGVLLPALPPNPAQNSEETRRNRAAFDFIVQNNLHKISGLKAAFGKTLSFPIEAIEVKANWVGCRCVPPLTAQLRPRTPGGRRKSRCAMASRSTAIRRGNALALLPWVRSPRTVIDRSVGGVTNQFTDATSLVEQEIALDLQVLAGLLPTARIVVYFTANTFQGLADAIQQAASDDANRPRVLSISWGSPEFYWTDQRREVVSAALCDAARVGISVVAAAGDQLATCGMSDGKAHVWFPASSPYVLGCGGTAFTLQGDETVWKQGETGTGGGISDNYPVPAFQSSVALPASVNPDHRRGRGVPDVAALAARPPGYRIVIDGQEMAKDGTSAATPLWAALLAMVNAYRDTPLGVAPPHLYGVPGLTRQIMTGNNQQNNIGYSAGGAWNACTGLGVPVAKDIIAALATAGVA